MLIKFETIEDKEQYIEENAVYDEEEDVEYFYCPACHSKYEELEDAVDCCPCSAEEIYDKDVFSDDED